MNKILVIGAGAMGAAFTFPLIDNNHQVTLTEPYNKDLQNKLLKKNLSQISPNMKIMLHPHTQCSKKRKILKNQIKT